MNWLRHKITGFRINRFAKRRQRDFNHHLSTLPKEEQRQWADGSHASQSHDRAERAQPIARQFEDELRNRGLDAGVEVGYYQMNRLVLSVDLRSPPTDKAKLPRFFRGFEVMYHRPGQGD